MLTVAGLLFSLTTLSATTAPFLETGELRPAFDHLGAINQQMDAAIASGCTVVYATGLGRYSYTGLPARAEMETYLAELREYNRKAHAGGARVVLSYLCATSIVGVDTFDAHWDDYFPGRPAGFAPKRMLQQDIKGNNLPSWYGGNYAPADLWNPYWRQYAKLTIKLAADSGHDGVFFDNPTVHPDGNFSPYAMEAWARFLRKVRVKKIPGDLHGLRAYTGPHQDLWRKFRATEAADFIREMQAYCKTLRPGFLLTVNNSLNAWDSFYSQLRQYGYSIAEQSRHEDLVTIEDMSSQPRRQGNSYVSYGSTLRLIHAIANGRPLAVCTTDGDYVCPPELMGLAIAECTAHDAAYMAWTCWKPDVRKGFAVELDRYQEFLQTNAALFGGTSAPADLLLVWPYENWVNRSDCPTTHLARAMSAASFQYDVVTEADLTSARLKAYRAVTFASEEGLARTETAKLLARYTQRGGKVIPLGSDLAPLREALGPVSVTLDQPAVRGVVRRTRSGEYLLHLYNLNVTRQDTYDDSVTPAENVHVSWLLPAGARAPKEVQLLTPDSNGTSGEAAWKMQSVGNRPRLDFVVPRLWVWTIVPCRR